MCGRRPAVCVGMCECACVCVLRICLAACLPACLIVLLMCYYQTRVKLYFSSLYQQVTADLISYEDKRDLGSYCKVEYTFDAVFLFYKANSSHLFVVEVKYIQLDTSIGQFNILNKQLHTQTQHTFFFKEIQSIDLFQATFDGNVMNKKREIQVH